MSETNPVAGNDTATTQAQTDFEARFEEVATEVLALIIFPDIILDNLADNE